MSLFFLLIFWIFIIFRYKTGSSITFLLVTLLFFIYPFLLLYSLSVLAEQIVTLIFLIIFIGILQNIWESQHQQRKFIQFNVLFSAVFSTRNLSFLDICSLFIREAMSRISKRVIIRKPSFSSILTILLIGVIMSFSLYTVWVMYENQRKLDDEKKAWNYLIPNIEQVEPKVVYRGTKIRIEGKQFKFQDLARIKLVNQYGEIKNVDYWSDSKIIFTVPLDWKTGKISLWIQNEDNWEGKKHIFHSNIATITLIDTKSNWTSEDYAYFDQIKYLDKEVLKLNGI